MVLGLFGGGWVCIGFDYCLRFCVDCSTSRLWVLVVLWGWVGDGRFRWIGGFGLFVGGVLDIGGCGWVGVEA